MISINVFHVSVWYIYRAYSGNLTDADRTIHRNNIPGDVPELSRKDIVIPPHPFGLDHPAQAHLMFSGRHNPWLLASSHRNFLHEPRDMVGFAQNGIGCSNSKKRLICREGS